VLEGKSKSSIAVSSGSASHCSYSFRFAQARPNNMLFGIRLHSKLRFENRLPHPAELRVLEGKLKLEGGDSTVLNRTRLRQTTFLI